MADLTKTQTILELQDDGYGESDPRMYIDPDGSDTSLVVEAATYWDMGGPLHITVTVEPGDKLNG